VDYTAVKRAVLRILKASPELEDFHITGEIEPVSTELCPAILVAVVGFEKEVRLIRNFLSEDEGGPYEVRTQLALEAWVFSAQGTEDCMRQLQDATKKIEDIMARNVELDGTVNQAVITSGRMRFETGAGGGLYAACQLTLSALNIGV
jgi:hypothetical protein